MFFFPYSLAEWYAQEGISQWQRAYFEERLLPAVMRADPMATVMVVSFHTPKSRILPVVRVESLKRGLRVWMRDNLHDWAVTVESERPVRLEEDPERRGPHGLDYCYFEGFERGKIPLYGSYTSNPTRFSFHGFGNDQLMEILGMALVA